MSTSKAGLISITTKATVAVIVSFQCAAFAQWGNTTPSKTSQGFPSKDKQNAPQQHTIERLKSKVELPDLPDYTGKSKFLDGSVEPAAKGGPRYQMSFDAQEPRSQVLDWYGNVFRMYNWKMTQRTDSSIMARHKDGHKCTVTAQRFRYPGGRENCRFSVMFQVASR